MCSTQAGRGLVPAEAAGLGGRVTQDRDPGGLGPGLEGLTSEPIDCATLHSLLPSVPPCLTPCSPDPGS